MGPNLSSTLPPSLRSFLPCERCLQGNGRNYFKKRAEGSGGSRWWLGHLGGRGRQLWPFRETMEPKHLPIPESTRAGPGGKSILKGREKAFLASQSKDRALDLTVLLTHFMTLEKFQPSSLLAFGRVGGPTARGRAGKQ